MDKAAAFREASQGALSVSTIFHDSIDGSNPDVHSQAEQTKEVLGGGEEGKALRDAAQNGDLGRIVLILEKAKISVPCGVLMLL